MMDDIVQEIIAAKELMSRWEPKHPQYVEGMLYLTQAQLDAVLEAFPPAPAGYSQSPHYAWGIPVKVIEPNTPVTLPSGKTLVYSTMLETFYVFPETIARDAGLL